MLEMDFTFPKNERLCSKILIDQLFEKGDKLFSFPLKVLFIFGTLPESVPAQVLISVSKRRFKRANVRNLLKRRLREAYRINKNTFTGLLKQNNLQLAIVIIYNSNNICDYQIIDKAVNNIFKELSAKL